MTHEVTINGANPPTAATWRALTCRSGRRYFHGVRGVGTA
jgi:hypothetical protein